MGNDDSRTGRTPEALERAFLDNLMYVRGKHPRSSTLHDYYIALAHTVRDRMLHTWVSSMQELFPTLSAVVYLSAEFLPGPQLVNNLHNIGILDEVRDLVEGLGLDFQKLVEQEQEPGHIARM